LTKREKESEKVLCFNFYGFMWLFSRSTTQHNVFEFFVENKGQWSKEVLFSGRTRDGKVWILKNGFAFDYFASSDKQGKRFLFRWDNANEPILKDFKLLEGSVNYLYTSKSVQTKLYNEIVLGNIYPEIDIRYYFDEGYLRFDVIVYSSRDLTKVKLVIPEQLALKVNKTNDIEISLEDGHVWINSPVIYLQHTKSPVNISYVVVGNILSFEQDVNVKTVQETLIIDPLIYSTYLAGSLLEFGKTVAIDVQGSAYLTGYQNQPRYNGRGLSNPNSCKYDAFVTKVGTGETSLVYSTYFGGNNIDYAYGISLDMLGFVNIIGETLSDDLPVTSGAHQTTKDNGFDIYLVRFD